VTSSDVDADLIVVGAGPAGSSTAFHAAKNGLDVLLLEKTTLPREKVCGDGLTPRGVRGLQRMDMDITAENGWLLNKGLRVYGGGMRLELPWPELNSWPGYGAVRTRLDLDEMLARQAVKAGARLHEQTTVTGAVRDERSGRVVGVTAKRTGGRGSGDGEETTFRAPLIIAADGNSARLALSLGRDRREDRPMGVAYRSYYRSPRTHDDYLESWLQLWGQHPETKQRVLLPGYGWIFGMGDGTANVGLGMLNTTKAWQGTDYRALMQSWVAELPGEWEMTEETRVGPIRGAALPMGFNRGPQYADGVLLVGDSAGAVNPFNGEGIAYALETGEIAAEVAVRALGVGEGSTRELILSRYSDVLADRYGGYYTLGRWFVKLIGDPRVMKLATERGLSHPLLMRLVLKLLANLTEPQGGDAMDRIINALARVAPDA
jgi:geranylgeranyl reductase family protein